ncbi:hypothetical protein LINGRAPRIM_LOCUS570 [Linum grandiflorum]
MSGLISRSVFQDQIWSASTIFMIIFRPSGRGVSLSRLTIRDSRYSGMSMLCFARFQLVPVLLAILAPLCPLFESTFDRSRSFS